MVTWGEPLCGGSSLDVSEQLVDVCSVASSSCAFAALRADGQVVTWGAPEGGGDSTAVAGALRRVRQLVATRFGFAALRADGEAIRSV